MKIRFKSDRLDIEVEAADSTGCFDELAGVVEVFCAAGGACGACGSTRTMPVVRENKGVHFREWKCGDCGCTLGLGVKKADGSLFPKRKSADGGWLDNNGWVRWQPKAEVKSSSADEFESF